MASTIQQAIAKAKAYGNGTLPIPGKKAYKDAIYTYRKLPLEKLEALLDKADAWLAENASLQTSNPSKWVIATAKLEALREAHAQSIGKIMS